MHIKEELITPRRAQALLDNHWRPEAQRKLTPRVVDAYAQAMRAGHWALTHQGIAIADTGELIDGLHRLHAIVQSGVPIQMLVTRNIPSQCAAGMHTIDVIDRGKIRGIGQQLQLRHGYANGKTVASICRAIEAAACRACTVTQLGHTVGNALAVLDVYGTEIKHVSSHASNISGLRNGAVRAGFAFAMHVYAEEVRLAYDRFVTGENMAKGDPMLTLRNHLQVKPNSGNGNAVLFNLRATLQALQKHVLREPLGCVKSNTEAGLQFFADKQKQAMHKVLTSCGYIEAKR